MSPENFYQVKLLIYICDPASQIRLLLYFGSWGHHFNIIFKDPPKLQIFHCWPYLKPILELKLVMNERTGSNLKNYLKTNKWEIQAQTSITWQVAKKTPGTEFWPSLFLNRIYTLQATFPRIVCLSNFPNGTAQLPWGYKSNLTSSFTYYVLKASYSFAYSSFFFSIFLLK